ncbi:M15 family metallopeptidase [Sanguibacter sp. 25GB23B1]|uniref:M15 family metallopeptidase n=1 Tax=Sanguibacter sp. 25GB23B1 TaxID=3156067 RepID=UPI0032AEE699
MNTSAASSASTSTSFDTVLAQAQALTTSSSTVAASGSARSTLNADGIPTDLAAYGNGKIPRDALAPIGSTGHRLWAPASAGFEGLLAAAKADGIDIGITDSYRTYESQVDLVARKGLYSEGGLAAKPGTSDHGWGLSVDLKLDGPALAWMRANGAAHGFVEDVPREPWHWTFQG